MPEGDTIFKLAQVLRGDLLGRTLTGCGLQGQGQAENLVGSTVTEVQTRGKHLLLKLDDEFALRVHLGMNGSWRRFPAQATPPRNGQVSVVLQTEQQTLICTQAMEVEVFPWVRLPWHRQLSQLGPDLLSAQEPDWSEVLRRLLRWHSEDSLLGEVLLDQRVAAGLGDVYRAELPFLGPWDSGSQAEAFRPHPEENLSPWTPIGQVSVKSIQGLYRRGRILLQANLGGWPRTTRFDRRGDKRPHRRGQNLWVYGRQSEPCLRCQTPIKGATLGLQNRVIFWCPRCQG